MYQVNLVYDCWDEEVSRLVLSTEAMCFPCPASRRVFVFFGASRGLALAVGYFTTSTRQHARSTALRSVEQTHQRTSASKNQGRCECSEWSQALQTSMIRLAGHVPSLDQEPSAHPTCAFICACHGRCSVAVLFEEPKTQLRALRQGRCLVALLRH